MQSSHKKAFTLVEMMIVVAIIAILATVIAIGYQNVRIAGDVTKVRIDMQSMETALQLYYDDYGVYPPANGGGFGPQVFNHTSPYTSPYWGNVTPTYTEFYQGKVYQVPYGYSSNPVAAGKGQGFELEAVYIVPPGSGYFNGTYVPRFNATCENDCNSLNYEINFMPSASSVRDPDGFVVW